MNTSPCYLCERDNKKLGCHDRCSEYQEYDNKRKLIRKKRAEIQDVDNHMHETNKGMQGTGRGIY